MCSGRVKEQQREEFFPPMAVWNDGCQEGLEEAVCLREHPGRWSGKGTPSERQGCVKWHEAPESLRGFGMTGEWMNLMGTSWGWTFILSKSLKFFLQQCGAIGGINRQRCGECLGVRGPAVTLAGEWSALGMSHGGWDVVIWGWGREQIPEPSPGWGLMALTSLGKWAGGQIWGGR